MANIFYLMGCKFPGSKKSGNLYSLSIAESILHICVWNVCHMFDKQSLLVTKYIEEFSSNGPLECSVDICLFVYILLGCVTKSGTLFSSVQKCICS